MSTTQPPKELWLGMVEGEWPIHAFGLEGQAIYWLQNPEDCQLRLLWKAEVTNLTRLELVEPRAYLVSEDNHVVIHNPSAHPTTTQETHQ